MRQILLVLALGFVPFFLRGQSQPLPDPIPPHQADAGKRLDPELKTASIGTDKGPVEQPAFWLGNKRIGVREDMLHNARDGHDEVISLMIDNKEVVRFSFWGAVPNVGFGKPFKLADGQQTRLDFDALTKTITYSKPYLLPKGGTATFHYILRGLEDGKVELSWDTGTERQAVNATSVRLRLTFLRDYREDGIEFDGTAVDFPDSTTLSKEFNKPTAVAQGSATQLAYVPDIPLKGFSVRFPDKMLYGINEYLTGLGEVLECNIEAGSKGSSIIDLGPSAISSAPTPPPVAGIDFWQHDALNMMPSPTRNLIPNPGFEEGLRYWSWWWGGNRYDPTQPTVYSISTDALFGGKSLEVQPYSGALAMMSFPIPVIKGKTYTLSFYGKAAPAGACKVSIVGMGRGSKYGWPDEANKQTYQLTSEWKRQSFTFEADTTGVQLMINAYAHSWFDGLQLEEGAAATEFTAPAIEGTLVTADPNNALEEGQPFAAKFVLSGKPGASGKFELTFRDFYKAPVFTFQKSYTLDAKGTAFFELPLEKNLGKGLYVIQAQFQPDGAEAYSDYFRISVVKSLGNVNPTRTFFGNSIQMHLTRGDDLGKMYMRWGWGYQSYGGHTKEEADSYAKYHIENYPSLVTYPPYAGFGNLQGDLIEKFNDTAFKSTVISDTDAKFIEDTVYDVVKSHPWNKAWALSTESEGDSKLLRERNFDEYAKVQMAFWKGVKRGNPDAKVYPDGGTSGFGVFRGLTEIKGYLASTESKIKWDAVAVHPYGALDGVKGQDDLDVNIPLLVTAMKDHGYGPETPIVLDECFNEGAWNIPEWDTGADSYMRGSPSYDQGWQEFQQASHVARTYLILLKYWPQLSSVNIWRSRPFVDQNFTPLAFTLVSNNLGNLFPNPKFKADIRPSAGIRGYAFEDAKGNCTVAMWCTIDKVDEGLERGPEINVRFDQLTPEVLDLMGNPRKLSVAPDGSTPVRLSSAPLFFRVPAAQADQLVATLSKAEVVGVGNSLRLSLLPKLDGTIEAKLQNQTGNPLKGKLLTQDSSLSFELSPLEIATTALPFKLDTAPGKINPWKQTIGVEFANGKRDNVKWDMSCLYVPHAAAPLPLDPTAPEWNSIPAIPLDNWVVKDRAATPNSGYPGDLNAKFQLAWDKDNLYLRVSAVDDKFVLSNPAKWNPQALYLNDGCVEVYLDTIANGRSNPNKGFDQYDYRYDFFAGNVNAENGPGSVYRLREVFVQLAGGMSMPTKEQAAKGVKCEFRRNGNAYSYVMVLPQMYLEPMHLEKGWRAGFGLYIHDRDAEGAYPEKGLSLATKKGEPCNYRPDLWPIIILGE